MSVDFLNSKNIFNQIPLNTTKKTGIIISLGNCLKIYRFSQTALTRIGQIQPLENFLNLDSSFENLWQNLWNIINLEDQIFYLTLPKNSFTSARIVYLWLQSWQMFENKKFFIHNFDEQLTLEIWENELLEMEKLHQILDKIRRENNQKLIYSAPVRIGQN